MSFPRALLSGSSINERILPTRYKHELANMKFLCNTNNIGNLDTGLNAFARTHPNTYRTLAIFLVIISGLWAVLGVAKFAFEVIKYLN
jgi:Na+-translocating ferredoxin:NAD+ oxidoreductase RnfA subunit